MFTKVSMSFIALVLCIAALAGVGTIVKAYTVSDLPAGNWIANPWFRSAENPALEGMDGWFNESPEGDWKLNQKSSNPSPDSYDGSSLKWGPAQHQGLGIPGVDGFASTIIEANPLVTHVKFSMWWIAVRVEEVTVTLYGGQTAEGPWTYVWTPFSQVMQGSTYVSSNGWVQIPAIETELPTAYPFYKLQVKSRFPEGNTLGFKFSGVFFGPINTESLPTPTPSPEPSLAPSPTPTVLPTPSPTPSPTATPIPDNVAPEVRQATLINGSVGNSYATKVYGSDVNTTDTLTLVGDNLPQGLSIQNCSQAVQFGKKVITCSLAGVPTTPGTYQVAITATDQLGASDTKVFPLIIN